MQRDVGPKPAPQKGRFFVLGAPDDILARATTQTCGGCHQVSNGAALGGGMTWPFSNGFTMIDEGGNLSPALTGVFLPFRLHVLETLACPGSGASAVTRTRSPGGGGSTVARRTDPGHPSSATVIWMALGLPWMLSS